MTSPQLESTAYDTFGGQPCALSRVDLPLSSVSFQPLIPEPVSGLSPGCGAVICFLGDSGRVVDAALAWLLTGSRFSRRLLVELRGPHGSGEKLGDSLQRPTKVTGARLWRACEPSSAHRLRDWLLFLQQCRTTYNTTAIASATPLPHRGVQLADSVFVVTPPHAAKVDEARRLMRALRREGVVRCECLWLDAA